MSLARYPLVDATNVSATASLTKPGVLVLSMHLPPENVPCTLQANFVLKSLRQSGFQAEGLATSLSPFTGIQEDAPHVHRTPEDVESFRKWQRFENIVSHYLKLDDYGNSWVPHATRAAAQLIASRKITGIVSISPPVACHLAALNLKKKYPHLKWVAMFQDPYLDNPLRRPSFLWDKLAHHREKAIFEHADRLVANTSASFDRWESRYPQHAGKISVAWTGYDPAETVGPLSLDRGSKPVLTHIGSIYGGRRVGMLLRSVLRLRDQRRLKPFDIRFVGPSELVPEDHSLMVQLEGEGWVRRQERVSRREALDVAGSSDYLLLVDTNLQNTSLQVPSKLFDYIRIGRPVLCYTQRDSMSERILARSGVRYECIYSDSSPEESDEALLRFLDLSTEPVQPTDWFLSTFECERQIQPIVSYFEEEADTVKI